MRKRLRQLQSPEELAQIYATPYDHTRTSDHELRSQLVIQVADWLLRDIRAEWSDNPDIRAVVADLSCGDAYIPDSIRNLNEYVDLVLGDICPPAERKFGAPYRFTTPIEQSILEVDGITLFSLNETLEHLDDPDLILREIRDRSEMLVISTPINEPHGSGNVEHLWSWGVADVGMMLQEAGWRRQCLVELTLNTYHDFMIIGAN